MIEADDAPDLLCITPDCDGEPVEQRAGGQVWLTCPRCKARWQEESNEETAHHRYDRVRPVHPGSM
jgi:uncharacterized C2H2 Zn-finger protein